MNNVILTAALIFAAGPAAASAPNVLTYQGRLLESGVPVSGNRTIGVQLCDALSAGTCYDTGSQGVAVQNGVFKTTFTLVTAPPLPAAGLAPGNFYLQITVNAVTLSPREQFTSAPYAVFSSTAETLGVTSATSPGVTISTNVGIGTAPSAPLHVFSAVTNGARLLVESSGAAANPARVEVRGGPASANAQLELNRPDANGVALVDFQQASASRWQLRFADSAASNRFDLSETVAAVPTPRLTVGVGGRMGVGVTAPTARLHVSSASAAASDAVFKVSTGAANGQEILTVAGDGFLGVGTTMPLQLSGVGPRLEVNGPANVVGQMSVAGGSGFAAALSVGGNISLSGALNLQGVGSSLTNSGTGAIAAGSGGVTSSGNITVSAPGSFMGDGSGLTSVVRLLSSGTLSGSAASMTLGLPVNMKYLRVMIRVVGATLSTNLHVRFNGDSGANYSLSRLTNGASTQATSQTEIPVFAAAYGTSAVNLDVETINNINGIKSGRITATDYVGATTAPGHVELRWVWENIGVPIGSVTVTATAGSMLAGTVMAAYGSN